MRCTPSDLRLSYLLSEEAVRPEEEEDKEDEKGDGVLPLRGYLPDAEILGRGSPPQTLTVKT